MAGRRVFGTGAVRVPSGTLDRLQSASVDRRVSRFVGNHFSAARPRPVVARWPGVSVRRRALELRAVFDARLPGTDCHVICTFFVHTYTSRVGM